jgi:hypothetical protein
VPLKKTKNGIFSKVLIYCLFCWTAVSDYVYYHLLRVSFQLSFFTLLFLLLSPFSCYHLSTSSSQDFPQPRPMGILPSRGSNLYTSHTLRLCHLGWDEWSRIIFMILFPRRF